MSAFAVSALLLALHAPWAEANDLAVALDPSIVIDRAPDSTTAAVEQSPKLNAELPAQSEDLLLGNIKGIRQWLSSRGIEVGVRLKTDLVQNFDGGIERKSAILSNLDMTFEVDLEKVAGFDGFRFFSIRFTTMVIGRVTLLEMGLLQATSKHHQPSKYLRPILRKRLESAPLCS